MHNTYSTIYSISFEVIKVNLRTKLITNGGTDIIPSKVSSCATFQASSNSIIARAELLWNTKDDSTGCKYHE